jgi:DNA-binding LacI/PurR family transcriptional regulator
MRETKKPEFKRAATIQDVAEAVGVTKTTVSKVFNGKGSISPATVEAILGAAKRLNFEPNPHARRLSQGHDDNTVGIFSSYMDWYSGARKLRIIQEALVGKGYDIPTYTYAITGNAQMVKQAAAAMNTLRRQRPRAIVCATHGMFSEKLRIEVIKELDRHVEEGGILICYDQQVPIDCDQVIFNRSGNIYLTIKHLLEIGHRKIGFCDSGGSLQSNARFQGFSQAMEEYGVEINKKWLFTQEPTEVGAPLEEEAIGWEVARQFLELSERPTAICVADDYAAVGCISQLQRNGVRVPEDVSIVGDDNAPIAKYGPLPLTTTSHPIEPIGRSVVELLESRLSGEYYGAGRTVQVHGELFVRESSSPPK